MALQFLIARKRLQCKSYPLKSLVSNDYLFNENTIFTKKNDFKQISDSQKERLLKISKYRI